MCIYVTEGLVAGRMRSHKRPKYMWKKCQKRPIYTYMKEGMVWGTMRMSKES